MIPKEAKCVFKGILFDVYQWEQEMFDGTKKTFEKLKRKDSANIIPIREDGRVILIEETQPGRDNFITTPGGQIENDEKPEDGARRELLEETGYTCERMDVWLHVQPYGNKIDWTVYSFIARGCKSIGAQKLDSGERISLKPVTVDEFFDIAMHDTSYRNTEITLACLRAAEKGELEKLKQLFVK